MLVVHMADDAMSSLHNAWFEPRDALQVEAAAMQHPIERNDDTLRAMDRRQRLSRAYGENLAAQASKPA
jgi:hypothetical protein